MGMDAQAYLWFGTSPRRDKPKSISDHWEDRRALEERLEARGVKLVHVPSSGDNGQWALALLKTYHHHDWDFKSERFDIELPTEEDKALLIKEATALHWAIADDELGWYQDATFY